MKTETVQLHKTTMTSLQREELVRILRRDYSFEVLSKMTDKEIHKTWVIECDYRWKE